ncbi:MAG: PTS system mannose/fructose/sorbose family transporter subunit IID [Solobacterium sp.]|jgi:PTS system mannose-specific IID component|nr:PTS system mannose/fructose/sorbose family transporter subunit IID [Solobacterium sp.]MCH4222472.1 PTS system mannose/fructose/sorbose family transporter subunit IID [Solobacterium sp.]MCH4266092.1 PTS system mannose/fructose/sorbose family transporter subunit IID [Solobacterium sp.]
MTTAETKTVKKIKPATLKKAFWNWFFWNGCSQQAESMLGMAFCQSMSPVIDELYDTKEEKAAGLKRHLTLFNTEAQVGSICNGIVCGLEESNANGDCTPDIIESVKVALIGPTSAIGDSLWVATIIPILLTICLSISQSSETLSWLGPVIYMIIYPVGTCALSWWLFRVGYKSGLEGMQKMMDSGKLDNLTDAMTLLGLIVVGALTASYVTCSLPIQIVRDVYDATTGTTTSGVVIFNADDTLNSIFPKILPLLLTLGVYDLYAHKKWSPMKLMMLILVMALVLTGIGYLCGVYA